MSDDASKKTRRVEKPELPDPDATRTAAPSQTGTGGSLGDTSGTSELHQPADRFTLTAVLGEGSQGEVCKAFDNLLQRHVAIKFPHRVGDEGTAREILAEARKAARLNHPNVVTIYEVGFWKNRPFIAMELVDGVSLATVLKECGRISVDRYLRYARQILKALCAAHDSGLIHRDLKPHNVLLAADGTLKLTDFGVAHMRTEVNGRESTINVSIAGTPAYMAPEQWLGKKPDARSDIYAFGCLSYKLLAGKNVFPQEDAMQHHLDTPAPRLRDIAPHVPENLDQILMRCLEKKPNARFQSSAELLHAIDAAAWDEDAPGTAKWPAPPATSRTPKVALAVILLILAGGGGWLAFTSQGKKVWHDLAQAAGLEEKTQLRPQEESPPDPVQPTPRGSELSEADRAMAARLQQGRDNLGRAMEAKQVDERLRLAELALQDLVPGSDEAKKARELVAAAQAEKQRTTEKMVLTRFESLLRDIREKTSAGEIEGAARALTQAEDLLENSAYLRSRSTELKKIKLPLLLQQARDASRRGSFENAQEHFEEACRLADMLGRKGERDRFHLRADLCHKLHGLQKLVTSQPALVLKSLEDITSRAPDTEACLLLEAQAWFELGAGKRSLKAVERFLKEHPDSPLVTQARNLKLRLTP